MVCPERKSVEPIAFLVGYGDASGLRKSLGAGPWPYDDVQAEAQSLFVDEPVPSPAGSPVGTVGVVDEGLHQEGGALGRGGAAAQRPARRAGQLRAPGKLGKGGRDVTRKPFVGTLRVTKPVR